MALLFGVQEERVRESLGRDVDMTLKNNIEAIVSKWSYQVGFMKR